MAFPRRPVNFVKAKNKNLDSVQEQAARSRDQEIHRRQENAGVKAREFYESLVAECLSSQKELTQDVPQLENKPTTSGSEKINCSSSKQSSTGSIRSNRGTKTGHKSRSNCGVHRLLRLCQEGDLAEIRKILKEGDTNLGDTDRFGWNALMCAAYSGHLHVVKFLIKKHPLGLKHRNKQGQSVLELAQKAGHDDVVEAVEQMEQDERSDCVHHRTRNREDHARSPEPVWCDKCESDFKDELNSHQRSTAHLFSCGHGPRPTHYHLPESNRGFQMMLQDGWDKEKGLGKEGEGLKFPVKTILKRDREGLGSTESEVKPRITHFKPFDTEAVKRPRKEKKKATKEDVVKEDTKRARHSKSHRYKAMEIDFRMSFHSQP